LGIGVGTIAGLLLALRWTRISCLRRPSDSYSTGWDECGVLFFCPKPVDQLDRVVALSGPIIIPILALLFISSAGLHVVLSAMANSLSMQVERPHIYMGVFATALDAGAAIGPLLAYFAGAWISFGFFMFWPVRCYRWQYCGILGRTVNWQEIIKKDVRLESPRGQENRKSKMKCVPCAMQE